MQNICHFSLVWSRPLQFFLELLLGQPNCAEALIKVNYNYIIQLFLSDHCVAWCLCIPPLHHEKEMFSLLFLHLFLFLIPVDFLKHASKHSKQKNRSKTQILRSNEKRIRMVVSLSQFFLLSWNRKSCSILNSQALVYILIVINQLVALHCLQNKQYKNTDWNIKPSPNFIPIYWKHLIFVAWFLPSKSHLAIYLLHQKLFIFSLLLFGA